MNIRYLCAFLMMGTITPMSAVSKKRVDDAGRMCCTLQSGSFYNLSVQNILDVCGSLNVRGNALFRSNVDILGNLSVSNLDVLDLLSVSNLDVTGSLNASNIDLHGDLTVSNLDVLDTIYTSNIEVLDTLSFGGSTISASHLDILGEVTMSAVEITDYLSVSNLDVTGSLSAYDIFIGGDLYLNSNLDVPGILTASNLDVVDTLSVSNLDILGTISGIYGVTTGMNDAIPVLVDSTGQLGTTSSSIKYKENVQNVGDITSLVMKLRPVIFNYINDIEKKKQYGLIAEEVETVLPELVIYDTEGQPYTVSYHLLYAILLNEIQKLTKEVNLGRDTIKNLIARVVALENV